MHFGIYEACAHVLRLAVSAVSEWAGNAEVAILNFFLICCAGVVFIVPAVIGLVGRLFFFFELLIFFVVACGVFSLLRYAGKPVRKPIGNIRLHFFPLGFVFAGHRVKSDSVLAVVNPQKPMNVRSPATCTRFETC